MSLLRRNPRRDLAESGIVTAFKQAGFSVARISGEDVPDLIIGKGGRTALVEVKTGRKPISKGQQAWHDGWRGAPVLIVRSLDDALAVILEWSAH